MINAINNILTNPTLLNVAQNTKASVSIETGLKAAGRPAFIMLDKNTDRKTRKFAAIKELLYQGTCLAIYMGLIMPFFKNKSVQIAKKMLKNNEALKLFKNTKEYTNYRKLADLPIMERLSKDITMFSEKLQKNLKAENPEKYPVVKGAIEAGSIVGSVLGLAIVAPRISHVVMKPIMNAIENKSNS